MNMTSPNKKQDQHIIFVSGASGSGTTLLTRLISNANQVVTIAGKHKPIPREDVEVFKLARRVNDATRDMWDRFGDYPQHLEAKQNLINMVPKFSTYEKYAHVTHVLMKRSAPFYKGDRYRPDVQDLIELFDDVKIIIIYRDPRASTFSSYRREFAANLRNTAVICEEQLTYLAAQLSTLNPAIYRVISYENLCNYSEDLIRAVAQFCNLPAEPLLSAAQEEKIDTSKNDQWKSELTQPEIDFLNQFFNPQRMARWQLLIDEAEREFMPDRGES